MTAETARSISLLASSRPIRLGVSVLISGLALFLVARRVDLGEVWHGLAGANVWLVGIALLSVAANTFSKVVRWRALMGAEAEKIRFPKALMLLLAGQALNTLFPARMGDVGRAYLSGNTNQDRAFFLGTIFIEKVLDVLAYAVLFVVLLLLIPLPEWAGSFTLPLVLPGALALSFALVLVLRPDWAVLSLQAVTRWLPAPLRGHAMTLFRIGVSSLQVLRGRQDLFRLIVWSGVIWSIAILTNHLVLQALQIQLPITASMLVLLGLQAGIAIPSVPGRIGVFEALSVLALAFFGVGDSAAFTFGVLLHAIVLVPTTLIGALYFWQFRLARS